MATYRNGADGTRLAIQIFVVLAGAWWYLYWILQPIQAGKAWLNSINRHTNWKFLGARGSTFFLQALPISVIAGMAYIVIALRRRRRLRTGCRGNEKPKVNIWTLPIILRSPLGMLTVADLVFILVTLFLVFYYLIKSVLADSRQIDNSPTLPGAPSKPQEKLEKVGVRFGLAAMIPFALLWFPVSRGSPILRLTGVSFERAVKYHTWLGLLTIWLLVAHGSCLISFFLLIHKPSILLEWPKVGVGIIPGWIALAAGCLMLVTAFARVRRKNFDMFFATHHLYLVFLVFAGFHRSNVLHLYAVPVLLFFTDRFMRMVQSRKRVDVLSARVLPSGIMELKFARPSSLEYHPLSFVYVLFPSVSRFEWHPFSVTSSPLDGTNQMSIYIKPLGRYTKDLHSLLTTSSQWDKAGDPACPFAFKLSLEGPYGDESCFFLKYRSLVLVAGGIGITPFLAIIRDIMHRHKLHEEDLPTDIQLIYCVRTPKEMLILEALNLNELCPNYAERVNIVFRPFVTSKVKPQNPLPDHEQVEPGSSYSEDFSCINLKEPEAEILGKPISDAEPMSAIHATGNSGWVAATVLSSMLGFFILWGIFHVTIIDENFPNYFVVLVFYACISLAVTVFGGGIMLLWSMKLKRMSFKADNKVASKRSSTSSPAAEVVATPPGNEDADSEIQEASLWLGNVTYGKRPDLKELFNQIAKQYGGNVGVLVSGGLKLQENVAHECKHHSLSRDSNVVLHYHSVSFEL